MPFFEQNIWASCLLLVLLVLIVFVLYFFRAKNTMEAIDKNNPNLLANFWKNKFGTHLGAVLQVLLIFIVLPLVAYLLTHFFSVGSQVAEQSSTGFLSQIMEKINNFFDGGFENLKNTPKMGGLFIAGGGIIMFIAVLLDADWIFDTRGHTSWFNRLLELVGRKTARILMGIPCVMLIISGLLISFSS